MVSRKPFIQIVYGMCDEVGNAVILKIASEFIDILLQIQDLFEYPLGNIEDNDMHRTPVLRETGGYLGAYECAGKLGDLQGALDGIVVCNRHIMHSILPGALIYRFRGRIAFRTVEFYKCPQVGLVGIFGVDMQVGSVKFIHDNYYTRRI